MQFINPILVSLSYVVILSLIYAMSYGMIKHLFKNNIIYYQIFLGIMFGAISMLFQLIVNVIFSNINFNFIVRLLPIYLFWMALLFISPYTAGGVLILNIVSLVVMPKIGSIYFYPVEDNFEITILSVSYILIVVAYIVGIFVKKITNYWKWSSIIFIILILIMSFSYYSNFQNDEEQKLFYGLIFVLVGYIYFGLLTVVDATHEHALKLRNIITYDETYYINQKFANGLLLEFINKNKISHGIFCNFYIEKFEQFENFTDNRLKNAIVNNIANQVHELFKDEKVVVFFKSSYKIFGIFVPLDDFSLETWKKTIENNDSETRGVDDVLYDLYSKLSQIRTKFTYNDYVLNISIKAVANIYGYHSNNLDKLHSYNDYYIKNYIKFNVNNFFYALDYSTISALKKQQTRLQVLDKKINMSSNITLFEQIYSVKENDIKGYFLTNLINGVRIESSEFDKTKLDIEENGLNSLFYRYMAFTSLKSVRLFQEDLKNKYLFVNYDEEYLSRSDFTINTFIAKLNKLKINPSQIVLCMNSVSDINQIDILRTNIIRLKSKGIKICLFNFGAIDSNYNLYESFQPDFLFMEKVIIEKINWNKQNKEIVKNAIKISDKLNSILIAPKVDSYISYKNLRDLGIKYMTGELVGSKDTPIKELPSELKSLLTQNT